MRVLALVVVVVMLLGGVCFAAPSFQDIINSLPSVKEGVAVALSKEDNRTYSLTQAEILNWKDKVCLNGGIATDFSGNNIEVASLSYKVGSLKDLGFNIPLEQFVNLGVGVWGGKDLINTGDGKALFTYGIEATIIKAKF